MPQIESRKTITVKQAGVNDNIQRMLNVEFVPDDVIIKSVCVHGDPVLDVLINVSSDIVTASPNDIFTIPGDDGAYGIYDSTTPKTDFFVSGKFYNLDYIYPVKKNINGTFTFWFRDIDNKIINTPELDIAFVLEFVKYKNKH